MEFAMKQRGFKNCGFLCLAVCATFASGPARADFVPPDGTYTTSWIGNSFAGDGGPNGSGYWVQNGAGVIKVTPDGTIIAGGPWDESGRCAGLYKDGRTNRVLLQESRPDHKETAWGWGTGNNALAVSGETLYIGNTGRQLIRFHWTPGDLDSARYIDSTEMPKNIVGLAATAKQISVLYKDALELRSAETLAVLKRIALPAARDAAFAPDGSLWLLAADKISRWDTNAAAPTAVPIILEQPSALSFDHRGRLLVCENGPRQQVLFYDVQKTPRLVQTFGAVGGLRAGTPGELKPDKLFALRGAGTDAQGNLYVGMGFDAGPNGNLYLRSFTPKGKLRWELYSGAFVDTFGFLPGSDGRTVYSRTGIYDLNLDAAKPGQEATLRALTLDPMRYPKDARIRSGCTALPRVLDGRRVLFTIGQYAGGFRLYTFENEKSAIAGEADNIGGAEQWAWDVTENGDIWHGDAPGKTIRRYPFGGWTKDGKPKYDWQNPQTFPRPEGWDVIRRIKYDPKTDSLYLFGYLTGQKIETWGVVGTTARRYDGWLSGKPKLRWTNESLPRDRNADKEGPITPQGLDIAGDYIFFGMVKPTEGRQVVNIVRTADGTFAGTLVPGPALGTLQGWEDMPYSVQATKRKNGEYLILVEEDARAKNILYRWRPAAVGAVGSAR